MSDPDNKKSNREAITCSEFEIEKISKLYQTALDLTSANEQRFLTGISTESSASDLISKDLDSVCF